MKTILIVFLTFVGAIPAVIQAQDKEPASAPAATQPTATEWTLPQQDDIYMLLPAGDKIYYVCADKNPKQQVPGGPPLRKRYSTYMCLDTKAGGVSNMLLTIPGKFDPDKLLVFGFVLSPDRKFAIMNVNSPAGSNIAGIYMVDLVKKKAKKFPPGGGTWLGKELILTVTDNQARYTQLVRYSASGARLGPLPICGLAGTGDIEGNSLTVLANPKALNKPLTSQDIMESGKLLVIDKTGKPTAEIPVAANQGPSVIYSPHLKFAAAPACFMNNAQKVPGMGMSMPLNATVFSLDGKTTIDLPEPTKPMIPIWVSDTGQLLSKSYNTNELVFWNAKGQKTWSVPGVSVAAVYDDKVYYIQADNPKVIKTKALVEKK